MTNRQKKLSTRCCNTHIPLDSVSPRCSPTRTLACRPFEHLLRDGVVDAVVSVLEVLSGHLRSRRHLVSEGAEHTAVALAAREEGAQVRLVALVVGGATSETIEHAAGRAESERGRGGGNTGQRRISKTDGVRSCTISLRGGLARVTLAGLLRRDFADHKTMTRDYRNDRPSFCLVETCLAH